MVSHSRRVLRRFVSGSREISLVSSLYRESTDSLIQAKMLASFAKNALHFSSFSRAVLLNVNGLI